MSSNVDTDEILKEFINFGIDYFLRLFEYNHVKKEEQVIPRGHVFHHRIANDVIVTQTLMRWYYRELFNFTFVKKQFISDIILYWKVWIQNRTTMYEKIIDAFAIIFEAKLYGNIHKSTPLSSINCKLILFKCFEYLKDDWYFFDDWDKFYSDAPVYPCSLFYEDYSMYHFKKNFIYQRFDDTFFHTMRKSAVKFPIKENMHIQKIECTKEYSKFVFIRLPTEMGRCFVEKYSSFCCSPLTEINIVDGNIVENDVPDINIIYKVLFQFRPQDRVWETSPTKGSTPSPIKDEIQHYDARRMMDWKKIFSYAVLKIEDRINNIVLISPRYNNSLEKMLSKRYSGRPGRFFGNSSELLFNSKHDMNAVIDGLSADTVEINWIEAVHLVLDFIFLRD